MVEALLLLQGACTHGIASAPAFGVVYKPAHHGSARPAVLRALSCNAVVVAWLLAPGSWLYPAAAACTGCALCAVRCPFDAIRMVRTQPLIEDV
jgi:ferredoxin